MRLRLLAPLLLVLALVAGCGGGDDDAATAETDVDALLEQTFGEAKTIKSGKLDVKANLALADGQSADISLSGPFQSEGEGRLPQLDMQLAFEGGGQSMDGGLTVTSDSAFLTLAGTSYEVPGAMFQQVKAGYEEAAKQSTDSEENPSFASLGVDPRRWLTNAQNGGEAKVGDTDTIKITGDVDVVKLLDDVNKLLAKSRELGLQGTGQVPEELTAEEKQQIADAVKDPKVEIYTGADDKILRRFVADMTISGAGAQETAVKLDVQLLDVNEDQEINAPDNAKPFEDLVAQLQTMGIDLGNLGGALGGGGGGAGGGGGPSAGDLEEYTDCVQQAGGDSAKVRECADLLTTP